MADDPWAAFGGSPEGGQSTTTTPGASASPAVSGADAWAAFGGAPVELPPAKTSEPKSDGVVRNVGAGMLEGSGAAINMVLNAPGNAVGKPLATGLVFAHDALAPVFGYNRFPDDIRNMLLSDEGLHSLTAPALDHPEAPAISRPLLWGGSQQPGTFLTESLPGANPADVTATTPAEQFGRKIAAGATGGAVAGPAGAVIGGITAPVGAAAAQFVPPWAAPATEMAVDTATGYGAGRVMSPVRPVTSPGRDALVENLQNENIPLTAGEITGSKPLLKTEQILGQAPGAAGPIAEDALTQQQAINRAVASRAGLVSDTLDPTTLNAHMDGLGKQIGTLASHNNMPIDPPFAQKIGTIRQSLPHLATDAAQEIRARLDQLNGMITVDPQGNPVVAGTSYQSLMGDLNDSIRGAGEGPTRTNLLQLKDTLRQQMESGLTPWDQVQWRWLNRAYANGKVIQDAMGAAGEKPAVGDISLPQLRVAINKSLGQDAYAHGYGDLNDLARAGQSVLRKPSDSGSPAGIMINRLLQAIGSVGSVIGGGIGAHYYGGPEGIAGGAVAGGAAPWVAPWAVSAAMRSRPGQAYLTNQFARDINPAFIAAVTNDATGQKNPLMP